MPWRQGGTRTPIPEMLRLQTDHAPELARRYGDEPAILAWDLSDEPPFWIVAAETTDAMAINWTRLVAGAAPLRPRPRPVTHRIPVPTLDRHAVDRYLSVAPMLGLDEDAADFSFPIPQEARGRIDALMHYYGVAERDLMVMAPSAIWETKRWNGEKFAEVARHFMQRGYAVILIGAADERAACEDVARLAPGAVNLAGETTLSELAALTRRAAMCVTNNSGPMHLAVALDRPVVSIFGPTDAVWIGPYRRPDAVLRVNLPCSPCYLRQLSRCMHAHACMRDVSASAVIERVESFLGQRAGNSGRCRVAAPARRR